MKKTIILTILLIIAATLFPNEQLSKSDWQHITYPAAAYMVSEQTMESLGFERETAEYVSLSLVLAANVAKEYYDLHRDGVSSMKDLELSIIGVATSYYINKGINSLFRKNKSRR
ncbi:MAG: hypothetical protein K9M99_02865 [Candidatus Cloacimonetes bacterium]|nr:hypothetical protein [Candidatus Cloacimonadota bacterium]